MPDNFIEMICLFKNICIFVLSSFVRAEWPENVRAFLIAHKISGVALPYVSYNDLHSPDKGLDSGEGDTVFLLPVLNLIEMSKNLSSATAQSVAIIAKQNHKNSRASLIFDLHTRSTDKLISDFLTEVDLKNEAYFFILENGHFESFKAYCKKERRRL